MNQKKYPDNNTQGQVFVTPFTGWSQSIGPLLTAAGLANLVSNQNQILIKPNLVQALDPPITTPVECIAALVDYLREIAPQATLLVGEGIGACNETTWSVFEKLGYTDWAAGAGIELVDLNDAELVHLEQKGYDRWPDMYLPKVVLESFLLSVPVLKAHSLAKVTLTMKNMMGCAPPEHFQHGGVWKKAAFHERIQESVFDLNQYRTPDFTLLDATVGMAEAHLWGPECDPPHKKLAAGSDPVAIDCYGASLLGKDWQRIGHLRMAHGILGCGDPRHIIEVGKIAK